MDVNLEKKILREMIGLYCRKNHKTKTLCPDCARLEAYALERIEKCPFRKTNPFPFFFGKIGRCEVPGQKRFLWRGAYEAPEPPDNHLGKL